MDDYDKMLENFDWEMFRPLFQNLTTINSNSLEDEMLKLPSRYSEYHTLCIKAKKAFDEENRRLVELTAELGNRASVDLPRNATKATAKNVENYIFSDTDYNNQVRLTNKANERYLTLKGLVSALELKKDMLVQLNANRRAETKLYN
tara:strand:+ start:360 stop:800 length:441 start_codon:yes stop_codon:yes gene_type:complete